MNSKSITTAAAGCLTILAALFLASGGMDRSPRPDAMKTVLKNPSPRVKETRSPTVQVAANPVSESDDAVNLAAWQDRFEMFHNNGLEKDEAVRSLISELDSVFGKWVQSQIAPLQDLPPTERYDRLLEIEECVREGAAEILDRLGIDESRSFSVLPDSLESISAEIQYAQAAPNHAARVAFLRLDQERSARLEKLIPIVDESERTRAMSELDAWYDSGLGVIFNAAEIADQ